MSEKKKPIIFSIDDDEQVLRSIRRDLRNNYRKEYRILSAASGDEALDALPELKKKGEIVALFLSDQRMPRMQGVEFLVKAKEFFPEAKRVLLTAYSDTDAAISAINDVNLDYYLMKPWDPPTERLYPIVDDLLDEWQSFHTPEYYGMKLIGYQYSPQSHRLRDFLSGNLFPYKWIDIEDEVKSAELIKLHNIDKSKLPAVVFEDGTLLQNPSIQEVAPKLGLNPQAKGEMYDVVIIGAGPAGLAAAVYGGSEGLKTLLVEKRAPGGQAGTSSRIENYLGFPNGLSGADLARRAVTQATRFGAELLSPQEVTSIDLTGNYKIITLGSGEQINTKSIVITTGVDYRKLRSEGVEKFTGAGVYYGAAMTEAHACINQDIFVVGGGNSAGQAAVHLAKFARKVTILIRKPDLTSSMSSYLIGQIDALENVEVHGYRQIVKATGDQRLEKLEIQNLQTNETIVKDAGALFIFIGAKPQTEWLSDDIMMTDKGYLLTGRDLKMDSDFQKYWKYEREPFLLETCRPGIFAAGDVRSGAMNRVASAVGEGAMSIKFVHEYIAEI